MSPTVQALTVILSLVAMTWFLLMVLAVALQRYRLVVRPIGDGTKEAGSPSVSILVPARNEAGRVLKLSIGSMVAQAYEPLEVIAVDDRSTDETLEVLSQLASDHSCLRVIAGEEPTSDWVPGKMFALEQARRQARGEWVLIADADLIFHPAAVRAAIHFAEKHRCDVLSIEVGFDCRSFWEKLIVPIHVFFSFLVVILSRVNRPGNRRAFSKGACVLMRRSAVESIGGFSAVKDQVPDTTALVCRLKHAGYRFLTAEAPELFQTRAYASIREIWENDRRNTLLIFGAKTIYMIPVALAASLFTLLPPLVTMMTVGLLFSGKVTDVLPLGIMAPVSFCLMIGAHIIMCRQAQIEIRYAFASPVAYATYLLVLVGAAYDLLSGRGVHWKGRRIWLEKQATKCVESSWRTEWP